MYDNRFTLSAIVLCVAFFTLSAAQTSQDIKLPSELNTTTHLQDYVLENRRNYNRTILNLQAEIDKLNDAYKRQVIVLEKLNTDTQIKVEETRANLHPLEVWNPYTKHCVQSNIWRISDNTPITKLANCVSTARSAILTNILESNVRTLNSYYTITLENALNKCRKDYNEYQFNYTICITNAISAANAYTLSMRNTFNSNLRQAYCTADIRISTAVDCVHSITYDIIYAIGQTNVLIENCIEKFVLSSNSTISTNSTTSVQICPYVKSLSFDKAVRSGATIENPLQGVDKSATCLQVIFV